MPAESRRPFCILFAGVVGSSKTPIATYLSYKLGLPIFSNDAIRSEVIEDVGNLNEPEYIRRRDRRLKELIESKRSFICDASIDREWAQASGLLDRSGYLKFIISLDLTKELLERLHRNKIYHRSWEQIDKYLADHAKFLEEHDSSVGLHISDENFGARLELSLKAAEAFINGI